MKKIIIDTDPGNDDALAIMLAVKSGQFDIKAITTVAGNSTIENTTRNARYILELLERKDIPVYSGSEKPLKRDLIQAVVHGKRGLEGINPINNPEITGNAVEKILEIIKENPYEITIVAIGPLTNIARAIQKSPEIMKKAKEIVIMGGAIKVPGNKNRVAEFNFFVDPEAADIVLNFPVKKTLVPLDACNKVKLQLEYFEKITNQKIREPVLNMIAPFIENIYKDEGINAALVYDALTVYYLLNPKSCKINQYDILIETKGELTRGMSVADLRIKPEKNNIIGVIEYVNENEFKRDFIDILSSDKNYSNINVIEKIGEKPGKTTVILAGVHGNEVCGVRAFDKIIPEIKIESGKVIFIYANLEAIKQGKRFIEKNLNRCFWKEQPIEISGSLEGKTAEEIIPYLEKADYMLDLHGCYIKDSAPCVICDKKQIKFAEIFDSEIVSYNWDEFEPGSTDFYINEENKNCIGFGFECGFRESMESQEIAEKTIINFLIFSENISGNIFTRKNQRILRLKGLYKNNEKPFLRSKYIPDFTKVSEKTLVGKEGEKEIFIDEGDIILFLENQEKLNQECFILAEEISKENFLNSNELNKSMRGDIK
jgi:inosine-uridine nucleoside N-ribohydrolase/succinylglutamate desuccinylase